MQFRNGQLDRGSIIGGYRIDEMISRGGMGIVYRATNVALNRIYALKVLAPELSDDEEFRDRFRREIRIAASLHHPHVVSIHYAGEHEGLLFLVMDFIYGTDLSQLLRKSGALEPDRAVEILTQLASALDAAHRKGLVHRDVKPANVLITVRDGEEHAYLTDFGLAKRSDTVGAMTRKGAVVGTVDYMAPEQITGGSTDARTDIYALGCTFFHMLTGNVPYERENSVATLFAHVHEAPPPIDAPLADTYPALGEVVEKAMAKAPADRYFSAGDLASAATAALRGMAYTKPSTVVATGEAKPLDSSESAAWPGAEPTVVPPAEPTAQPPPTVTPPVPPTASPTELSPSPPKLTAPPAERAPAAPPTEISPAASASDPPPIFTSAEHAEAARASAAGAAGAAALSAAAGAPASPTEGANAPRSSTPAAHPSSPPTPRSEPASPAHPSSSGPTAAPASPPPSPRPPRNNRRFGWFALAGVLLVAAVVATIILVGSGNSSPSTVAQRYSVVASPVPLNRVTGAGAATVVVHGNIATVSVDTNGLLDAAHLMHIHGGSGKCPTASAAQRVNGASFIPASAGDQVYGGVVTSLTTHGTTSPAVHGIASLFPATGNIRYTRTLTLPPGVAAEMREGLAVIVVHGIDYNGNGVYDNSLGPEGEAAAPALCGALFPSPSASIGDGERSGVVYTATLDRFGGDGATQLAALALLCHLAGLPAGSAPTSADPRVPSPA